MPGSTDSTPSDDTTPRDSTPAGTRFDWVSFTTDYGQADGYVAACHGVVARLAPHARVIDVTHEIALADVRRAAAVLAETVDYLPTAVHLAVIDPGVGTSRRAVAVDTGAGVLVGPDNGLLPEPAEVLGGVRAAVELPPPAGAPGPVSHTFHGRDLFAPAAARIAAGAPLSQVGVVVDPDTLTRLPEPVVATGDGWLEAEVRTVDRFGNVQLAARAAELDTLGPVGTPLALGATPAVRGDTFADAPAGGLVVLVDSAGYASVAVNRGRAVVILGVTPGERVRIEVGGAG